MDFGLGDFSNALVQPSASLHDEFLQDMRETVGDGHCSA